MADLIRTDSERFQTLLARHQAFWEGKTENTFLRSTSVHAPSTAVALPQSDGSVVTRAERLQPDMVDIGAMIDEIENLDLSRVDATLRLQGQFLVSAGLGDVMPVSRPWVKMPWVEAMLGCPIKMTEGQIWNEHYPGDPEDVIRRGANFEHNPWLQLYVEFLQQLQARLGDRFPVSANTLIRGTSDLVAAVMGVQEACMGWIDRPKFMAQLLRVCTDAILTVIEAGYKVLAPFQGGYPSGYAIWAPDQVIVTQADHSTLLSAQMYKEQILPFDLEVIRSCPFSMFHIHNNGLHIAPVLVEIPELNIIEVTVDPYPTGERKAHEVEMMQFIQEHKSLYLDVYLPSYEEGEWLLAQLPTRRLCFNAMYQAADFDALPPDAPGTEAWHLA
jgi:hypothetical protein